MWLHLLVEEDIWGVIFQNTTFTFTLFSYFGLVVCSRNCSSIMSYSMPTPWTIVLQALLSIGIFQARILEWVTIPFSRGSSWPKDQTWVSYIADKFFTIWATREAMPGTKQSSVNGGHTWGTRAWNWWLGFSSWLHLVFTAWSLSSYLQFLLLNLLACRMSMITEPLRS